MGQNIPNILLKSASQLALARKIVMKHIIKQSPTVRVLSGCNLSHGHIEKRTLIGQLMKISSVLPEAKKRIIISPVKPTACSSNKSYLCRGVRLYATLYSWYATSGTEKEGITTENRTYCGYRTRLKFRSLQLCKNLCDLQSTV